MADAAFATQPPRAADVSRVERSSARGAIKPVRPVGQTNAFQRNIDVSGGFTGATSTSVAAEQPSGSGLLSTGVQMLLAETRTQEAGATFVPPSNVGRALNSYLTAQEKVRETIRDNLAFQNAATQKAGEAPGRQPDQSQVPSLGQSTQASASYGSASQLTAATA